MVAKLAVVMPCANARDDSQLEGAVLASGNPLCLLHQQCTVSLHVHQVNTPDYRTQLLAAHFCCTTGSFGGTNRILGVSLAGRGPNFRDTVYHLLGTSVEKAVNAITPGDEQ